MKGRTPEGSSASSSGSFHSEKKGMKTTTKPSLGRMLYEEVVEAEAWFGFGFGFGFRFGFGLGLGLG